MARIVVGVSGASGVILAVRTLNALANFNYDIELVMTPDALYTASLELGKEYSNIKKFVQSLPEATQKRITVHGNSDTGSAVCSGSYPVKGMVIIPCSMTSIAAISCGLGDTTLRRAADVTIKERRTLVVVPRETPFGEIHLENMLRLSKRGVVILPPIPAWYSAPKTLEEIENFVVGKVLDCFGIENTLYKKWKIDI